MSSEHERVSEATFADGELAIVVHTPAGAFRLRERRRTAISLSSDAVAKLARELIASLEPEAAAELAREVFTYAKSA